MFLYDDNIDQFSKKEKSKKVLNYGANFEDIFTKQNSPQISYKGITKLNSKMRKMMYDIKTHYGDDQSFSHDQIAQYMIYSRNCPHCKKIKPIFEGIGREITKTLPYYIYDTIEVNEIKLFHNQKLKGVDIFEYFENNWIQNKNGKRKIKDERDKEVKKLIVGVPIIIQNFEVINKKFGNQSRKIIKIKNFYPVYYEGEFKTFRFLSNTFQIKNRYIKRF